MDIRNEAVFQDLKALRGKIPESTYRTIKGQIKAGDASGAAVGIERLKRKLAAAERAR